ncbi:MAG: NADH-quinone oxidoreductase subunit C, partial [Halapricum sp.]
MSLEQPEPPATADDVGVTEDGLDYAAIEALIEDNVIGRESHVNAEGFVIRPDAVQDTLSTLKEEAGFDHCSAVTAQEYADRFESIYHLKKFDDP